MHTCIQLTWQKKSSQWQYNYDGNLHIFIMQELMNKSSEYWDDGQIKENRVSEEKLHKWYDDARRNNEIEIDRGKRKISANYNKVIFLVDAKSLLSFQNEKTAGDLYKDHLERNCSKQIDWWFSNNNFKEKNRVELQAFKQSNNS